MDIRDIIYDHSVKIQLALSVLFFFFAVDPVEYFLGVMLAGHAFLDWREGKPLI
jgi:hypothetical protein